MTLALAFERPDLLWALALAAPLVAFHLYRRRRRLQDVAFAPLLSEVAGPAAPRAFWRSLKDAASLLARVLALASLVLAAAGPRDASASVATRDLVVVLDADPTTLATESPTESRFQRQVALAKAHLLAPGVGRVAIVSTGAIPHAFVPPTFDRASAATALDALRPGLEPADLASALAVARAAAASLASPRILVISSRAVPGEGDDPALEVVGAGTTDDDVGIVDQKVIAHEDGVRWSVAWTLRNFAGEPRRRAYEIRRDQAVRGERREIALDAHGSREVREEVLPRPDGEYVRLVLDPADAFDLNDDAMAFLPPFPRPSVLVVHGGTPRAFTAAVLAAMGDSIDRERSGWVTRAEYRLAAPREVTVFDGVAPPPGAWAAGAYVVLAPFGDASAWGDSPIRPGRAVSEPLVWRAEEGHPLLRGVDLSTAYVAKGATIAAPGASGLAFVEGDPVVAEGESGAVRWIAFGLDPEGSDLPLRAALPVLLRNAIRRLATAPKAPFRPFYRAGEPIRPRFPVIGEEPFGWEQRGTLTDFVGGSHASRDTIARRGVARPTPESETWSGLHGYAYTIEIRDGKNQRVGATAVVDLDPGRDITPVREASYPPAPGAAGGDRGHDRWGAWLLLVAGVLLLLDLWLIRGAGTSGKRNVARAGVAA